MCCRCPRQYYYAKNDPVLRSDKYTICKQISMRSAGEMDEETLWNEISMIQGSISPDMREYLTSCINNNRHTLIPSWTDANISVSSPGFGMYGLIDKYHADEGYISIIRSSSAPKVGCWPDDRIRIAAYLVCLKETTGIDLQAGYVEYIPDGIIRYCEPVPRDRRALIHGLQQIKKVQKGVYPEKPLKAPCKNCWYQDRCEKPVARKLSDILFRLR